MTVIEMLESVQYLVDNQGWQTAVQFDLETWDALRPLFEEVMEDAHLAQLMDETAVQAYQEILAQV